MWSFGRKSANEIRRRNHFPSRVSHLHRRCRRCSGRRPSREVCQRASRPRCGLRPSLTDVGVRPRVSVTYDDAFGAGVTLVDRLPRPISGKPTPEPAQPPTPGPTAGPTAKPTAAATPIPTATPVPAATSRPPTPAPSPVPIVAPGVRSRGANIPVWVIVLVITGVPASIALIGYGLGRRFLNTTR